MIAIILFALQGKEDMALLMETLTGTDNFVEDLTIK